MQTKSISITPTYFVINRKKQYEPYMMDDRSLLEIFNAQNSPSERIKLPVSARCHRVVKGDRHGDNKENSIKQGQVLNVYYKPPNPTHTSKHFKSQSTVKKQPSLGFDIDRNLHSIDKSIFLYQKSHNKGNFISRISNTNEPFQQILFKSSAKSSYQHHEDKYDRHSPHWLINKKQKDNQQGEKSQHEIKKSIIDDVMVLDDKESLQLGQRINQVKSHPQQQQQTLPLPRNKIITHLLTQSQRQLPLQKYDQKFTNLHPKPCQSLILESQPSPKYNTTYNKHQQKQITQTYMSREQFYQQEMKRRQQADQIMTKLTSLEVIK